MIVVYLSVHPASRLKTELDDNTIPSKKFWNSLMNNSFNNCRESDDISADLIMIKGIAGKELRWVINKLEESNFDLGVFSKEPTDKDNNGDFILKTRNLFEKSSTSSVRGEVALEKWSAQQKTDNSEE